MSRRTAILTLLILAAPAPLRPQPAEAAPPGAAYHLQAGDVIRVYAVGAPEVSTERLKLDPSGEIRLPMLGRFRAGGQTAGELEERIGGRLATYIREPEVTVSVQEFASRPISVLGAVQRPGVIELRGTKTLAEALSEAGGLRDDAGPWIQITRRNRGSAPPLPGAELDETGLYWTARITVEELREGGGAAQHIQVEADDVISAPRADMVYVIGAVQRAGGLELAERDELSVLQALAKAGGLGRHAAPRKARIVSRDGQGGFRETVVDLKAMMAGKRPDFLMKKDEILVVPTSGAKVLAATAAAAAVTIGTGAAIWVASR